MNRFIVATVLLLCPQVALAQSFGVGQFSKAKEAGTEIVTLTYKDANNKTQTVGANVTLAKGTKAADKAKKIAAAITANSGGNLNAVPNGHVVTVVTTGANKGVRTFKVTNNTKEAYNRQRVIRDPITDTLAGVVTFEGFLTGYTEDGELSEVMVGTDRGEVSVYPAEYDSIGEMVLNLWAQLLDLGITVQIQGERTLLFALDAEDGGLANGCTDLGIVQSGEAILVEDDSDEIQDVE